MGDYCIISLGKFICGDSLNVAMESFSILLEGLSNKYKKKTKIFLIDKKLYEEENKLLIHQFGLQNDIKLICMHEQEKIIDLYAKASILFIPCKKDLAHIFTESFSYGLPVLTYAKTGHEEYVDQTCGLLVEECIETEVFDAFAQRLQLLLFDPDARLMLKKGASNKFEKELSWGRARSGSK